MNALGASGCQYAKILFSNFTKERVEQELD
jgi:hypothetical protein